MDLLVDTGLFPGEAQSWLLPQVPLLLLQLPNPWEYKEHRYLSFSSYSILFPLSTDSKGCQRTKKCSLFFPKKIWGPFFRKHPEESLADTRRPRLEMERGKGVKQQMMKMEEGIREKCPERGMTKTRSNSLKYKEMLKLPW